MQYHNWVREDRVLSCESNLFVTFFPAEKRPTLETLEDLKVKDGENINTLERIGTDYDRFGIKLLKDSYGDAVAEIKDDQRTAKRIKREIARQWLRGKGKQPVTWRTLVMVLAEMELTQLTKDICEALQ